MTRTRENIVYIPYTYIAKANNNWSDMFRITSKKKKNKTNVLDSAAAGGKIAARSEADANTIYMGSAG